MLLIGAGKPVLSQSMDKSSSPIQLEAYKQFLDTLDSKEKESVLKARDEFFNRFSNAPPDETAKAFGHLEAFYNNAVIVSGLIYFRQKNSIGGIYNIYRFYCRAISSEAFEAFR